MRRVLFLLAALVAFLSSSPARSEYPEKPIRIIVPFAGGGGIDAGARSLGKGLSKELGQTVIVENRPGANSVIGSNAVAMSPADGYTLLFTSGSTVSVLPHISRSLPFDPQRDLIPVGKVAKLPFILLVNQEVKATNLRQFISQAKASPGKLTYASAGSGTGSHLGFELLKKHTAADITHVPYKATAEALPDLLTGRVLSMMADPSTARRAVAEGSVRALAVTTKERSTAFPDVPTVAEQGVDGFDLELWFGVFAPKGTPPEVVSRINAGIRSALLSPEGSRVFDGLGFTIDPTTPEQLDALAKRESVQWADLARSGALKID